jgi:hypothetical protein
MVNNSQVNYPHHSAVYRFDYMLVPYRQILTLINSNKNAIDSITFLPRIHKEESDSPPNRPVFHGESGLP